jgi:hypothetical protein
MSKQHEWSDDELSLAYRLRKEKRLLWPEIAKRFGVSAAAMRGAIQRWLSKRDLSVTDAFEDDYIDDEDDDAAYSGNYIVDEDGEIRVIPTILQEWREHENERPSWQELIKYAESGAQLQQRLRPVLRSATRVVETKEDIYVAHVSDLHLGAAPVDYGLFMSTSNFFLEHPRLFLIINGPDLEFALTHFRDSSAVLNQVMPPWMQLEAFRLWLKDMLPRTLCMCGDNHVTERLERFLGDIGLALPQGIPYFQTFGKLTLKLDNGVGDPVTYTAVLTHKYKGHSIYHNMQPALRAFRDIDPTADWYATAHTHKPGYLEGVWHKSARPDHPRQRMVVSGTFKNLEDVYALRNYGSSGVLGIPTLRLSPDKWDIDYFKSPESAFR